MEVLNLCMEESVMGFNIMTNDKRLSEWWPPGQCWKQVPNGIIPGKSEHRVTSVLMTAKKNLWLPVHDLK